MRTRLLDSHRSLCAQAPHSAWDADKLASLVEAMEAGESIPAIVCIQGMDDYDQVFALTGSHRLASADAAGVDLPVWLIKATNVWESAVLEMVRLAGDGEFDVKVELLRRLAVRKNWKRIASALEGQ